jgi:hypothetical protein
MRGGCQSHRRSPQRRIRCQHTTAPMCRAALSLAPTAPIGAPAGGGKHDRRGVPPSPPCAACCTRGTRPGLCRNRPRSSRVRSHPTRRGQSRGQRCRIRGICETPGGHRAWGCGGRPGRRTGLLPAASVSGFFIAHPEATYFNVGKIGNDQLQDMVQRRGVVEKDLSRLLAPNL